MDENFGKGVEALKAGDRITARQLLGQVVRQSPQDAQAWLWLSGAVDKDDERIYCLRQVLKIDPENALAARGLAQILGRKVQPPVHGPQAASPPELKHLVPEPQLFNDQPADPAPLAQPPAAPVALPNPNLRFMDQPESFSNGETVFKVRPSLAQTLAGFWLMFFLILGMNGLMQEDTVLELSLSFLNCSVVLIAVFYLIIGLSRTRYELTTRQLSVATPGRQIMVPIRHILSITPHQSGFQKWINAGDLLVEASVAGELNTIRLHNVSSYNRRMEQFQNLLQSHPF